MASKGMEMNRGDTIQLIEKPDGYESRHYPLTVGNQYTVIGWMGSAVQITCDDPDRTVAIYHGRMKVVRQ